jgi:uncharacterized protein YfaS (alpha-2-macroglobulin family)
MKILPKKIPFIVIPLVIAAFLAISGFFLVRAAFEPRFSVSTLSKVDQISNDRLGRLDSIVIRFKEPIPKPDAIGRAAAFSPAIAGSWAVRDDRTVEFTPEDPYRSRLSFRLAIDTGLLAGKEKGLEGFVQKFAVKPADYSVEPEGLYAEDQDSRLFSFSGTITADIPVSERTIRSMVSAGFGKTEKDRGLAVEWERAKGATKAESSAVWRFTIRHIPREKTDRVLTVAWKGGAIGSREHGKKSYLVPAREDFRVLEIATVDPSSVEVRFSDRIDPAQDIRGLVRMGNAAELNVRYSVDANVLKVYAADGWKGDGKITVLEGFRSSTGKTLMREASAVMNESWEIPEVRFAGEGVILPPNNGVVIPVETKNIRGLIIEAYQIYGDNILQFLQTNELDGSYELRRVGAPVWSKSFDFNWDDGMKNRYVPRGLDLTELIKKFPGGMYQLRVTFRHRHVMYECTANHPDFSSFPMPSDEITNDTPNEYSYWDWYGDMDWKKRRTYWEYQNDPCHPAFYLSNYHNEIVAKKNVLISNLGILAKKDQDGAYTITVADIANAAPVANADVTLYSFAQKELSRAKTDATGTARFEPVAEPYFITAGKEGQVSYLRIDSGTALSVSHFEVDGDKAAKGIKGFIYGERGVWRPGDDIHLVFVLQDLAKRLPANFPVTFELQDPMGRIAKSGVYSEAVNGFYRIDTATASDAATGLWIARVKAGGQTWTRSLKIEMVVPNRLSIDLKTSKAILGATDNPFVLTGAWLHGAKAAGLKADVAAIFFPGDPSFPGYADYTFTNPERHVESERKTVWEGSLDQNSSARFNLSLSAGDSLPGKLRAQLITRIFEPSGMFSIEQASFDYSPYNRYVGIKLPKGDETRGMLLTDTKHRMDIALLDSTGKPVTQNVQVKIAVYKLQWRWWWEKDALTDATYVSERSTDLVTSGETLVKAGKGSWDFEINYPEWGRYLVVASDEKGGHSSAKVVYVDWPGWAGRSQEAGSGSAAMLTLVRDKPTYKTGETAQISFASGADGRALVTVEKNGKIARQDWLETTKGTTVYRLPLTEAMAPNVYVHITLLQKHLQTANSLPIRLYGVIPVMVENPATRLTPVIKTASQYEPGKKASVEISETSGKAMTYTVAVVDEGLLGLTRFKANDPWNEFYKKEASLLESWDLYRYVMSAFGGKLETLISVGGAEQGMSGNNKKAERFKPVVLFFGPYNLPAGGKTVTEFEMPQYIGAVRVMVIAGQNGAYGTAEKTVPVKSDLMVLPTLPRSLGLGETIDIPVTVFNGRDAKSSIEVKLMATGSVQAELAQTISVDASGNATATFRITAATEGIAKFAVSASRPGSDATEPGARADALAEIDVLSRGSPISSAKRFTVLAGERYRDYIPSPGEKGSRTMSVELSTLPVLDLQTRLKYLVNYPHGCIEQITSGGFPQLYVPSFITTTGEENERIKKNVASVIARYPSYQTASGGFAYWPGEKEESYWGTSYAGHFMAEAKKAGYAVPDSIFKPWLSFQSEAARNWQPGRSNDGDADDATLQAYRLYTLALSGFPELGAMNRLATLDGVSDTGTWLLAGSYALSGHADKAREMTADLAHAPQPYRETGNTWGSDTRDSAIILSVLSAMGDERRAADMIPKVAEKLGSDSWYSTQETAWLLIALAPYYHVFEKTPATYAIEWDKGDTTGEISRGAVIRELDAFESPTQTIVVKNTGAKNIYGKVVTRGKVLPGKEKKIEEGLALTVKYTDSNGNEIRPAEMKIGDSFTVSVRVTNLTNKKVENLALSLPIPTTWEFGNDRVGSDEKDGDKVIAAGDKEENDEESSYDGDDEDDEYSDEDAKPVAPLYRYQDIRDTNIYTYFSLGSSETKTFTFYATVAFEGNYYVPASRVEAMYDAEYQAISPGQAVTRVSPANAE